MVISISNGFDVLQKIHKSLFVFYFISFSKLQKTNTSKCNSNIKFNPSQFFNEQLDLYLPPICYTFCLFSRHCTNNLIIFNKVPYLEQTTLLKVCHKQNVSLRFAPTVIIQNVLSIVYTYLIQAVSSHLYEAKLNFFFVKKKMTVIVS